MAFLFENDYAHMVVDFHDNRKVDDGRTVVDFRKAVDLRKVVGFCKVVYFHMMGDLPRPHMVVVL